MITPNGADDDQRDVMSDSLSQSPPIGRLLAHADQLPLPTL